MKQGIQSVVICSVVLSSSAYAIQPIQGWYVGLNAAVATGPSTYTRSFTGTIPGNPSPIIASGTVNNNLIGGGIGGNIGFRWAPIRLEAEIYYNYNGTRTLTTSSCTLESPGTPPAGNCSQALLNQLQVGFNGSTGVTFGLINFYYDFFNISDNPDSQLFPYLGIGVGMADVKTGVNFVSPELNQSVGGSKEVNVGAGQIIVGLGYFMDDYAWIQADYRYTSTSAISAAKQALIKPNIVIVDTQGSSSYALNMIMFAVNFSFDNSGLNAAS